jgi:outer membrane protein
MLRLIIGALITLSLVLGPLGTLAAELRIGTADPDAILGNSPEGKRVQEAIKRKAEELGRPLGTRRQDIGRQMEEYQKQASMMKDDAKKRKEEELTKKAQEFERQAADAEKQLNQFKESQLAPLSKKMDQALEQVAKDEKLDIILDRRMVLYLSNKALDISDKVRAKFGQ